jgi:hypothetical protein
MTTPNQPNKYVGTDVYLPNVVVRNRRPTGADYRQPETGRYYVIWGMWQVGKDPTSGVEGELWVLAKIVANVAYWIQLTNGVTPPLQTLTGDDLVAIPPSAGGDIDILGQIVANGTHVKPLYTTNSAANTMRVDLQVATTVSPTPANTNSCGVSCFNQNQFQINATSGMVSLIGSTTDNPVLSTTGDDGLVVTADNTGTIFMLGNAVANGTHPKPLYTTASAANTERFDIQVAKARTGAPANMNDAGICSFDDTVFTVNANGYVTLTGGNDDLHTARYIVSPGGLADGANYTTIASAYAAAVLAGAPQTVFVQPGTYTENITTTAGINLVAFTPDARSGVVTIIGKITATDAGSREIANIRLRTNADYCVSVTGANAVEMNLTGCYIYGQNNNAINMTAANAELNVRNCTLEALATFNTFAISDGVTNFNFCIWNGGSAATNTVSGGRCTFKFCQVQDATTTSGTSEVTAQHTKFGRSNTITSTTKLVIGGSGNQWFDCCTVYADNAAAITITSEATITNTTVYSNTANAITGAGTINHGNIVFTGTGSTVTTATQNALVVF